MSIPGLRSLLTVLDSGFESCGIVVGAGAFQVVQPLSCWGIGSGVRSSAGDFVFFDGYEDTLRQNWSTVVDRLEDEARRVGAHGVIGVTAIEQRPSGGQSMMELQLIGTAVRVTGAPLLQRPFLSALGMEETLMLLLRGWVATGVVFGLSAVHVHSWAASPVLQGSTFSNAEMAGPTAGMQFARDRAEHNARAVLALTKGDGTVASAVELTRASHSCNRGGASGVLIQGRFMGTAVTRFGPAAVGLAGVRDLASGGSRRGR